VLVAFGAAQPQSLNPLAWLGSIITMLGMASIIVGLYFFFPHRRQYPRLTEGDGYHVTGVTVALTAYNDEESIGHAVADFLSHPLVKRVIVVSNNSRDATEERAKTAGAIVYNESNPGYGQCVYRCLTEAVAYEDTECVALCEGDMTFRARDLTKLLAFLPHAEIVNGTRIVEQLRAYDTQLTTFMYYGNFFVGKLLEAKHFGKGTFTDVGTTYKILRRGALLRLLPALKPGINLEFNAHFLDTMLAQGFNALECPITFHARVGQSKGGNVNDFRAMKVGIRMILGLMFGWGHDV
jgi:glycosyltransferase involved in cell wall biosynthesis